MYHSRANALLTGGYYDRVADVSFGAIVPTGSVNITAYTYTAGANVMALIEDIFILLDAVTTINLVDGTFHITRTVANSILHRESGIVGARVRMGRSPKVILRPGDTLSFIYNNTDGANRIIVGVAHLLEIDL